VSEDLELISKVHLKVLEVLGFGGLRRR